MTAQTATIADFLLARIAEDRRAAQDAKTYGGTLDELSGWVEIGSDQVDKAEAHFGRWSPVRVLAECEAKRRIVEALTAVWPGEWSDTFVGTDVLRALAQPHADHPDFQEAWRV